MRLMFDRREDFEWVARIVTRALNLAKRLDMTVDAMDLHLSLAACHLNGCPLKLKELAESHDMDFCHDVFGILHRIETTTGSLTDCFTPRYAAQC